MNRIPTLVLAFAAVMLSACSSGGATAERVAEPPAPEPLDPVGAYTFSTSYQGMPVVGRITIRGEPGSYTGILEPEQGPPPVEIYSVTVEGQTITAYGDAGGEDLIVTMTFSGGDTYTGTWVLSFDSGEMTGERIKQ